ncbi:MAG: hypothetical protein K2J67_04790 [Lachnospiraceae bacterium]|nr:hypothetical protein [Lachnospiraceae bacterium]
MKSNILKDGENRKHIRILFFILALGTILIMISGYQDPYRQGIILADKHNLRNTDYYILKEGYYCGEGGVKCDHGIGFIYYTAPMDEREAMEKAGFKYITAESEYCNSGNWAQIEKIRKYKNSFLLYYLITGAA